MNALRPTVSRAVRQTVTRRAASSAVPKAQKYNFKQAWLSDPSTYPLMIIMGCAVTFMTGMGIHALVAYKDVTVDPSKRNAKLQTWGEQEVPSLTKRATYWNSWQKHNPEGLGVDHQKWLESKKTKST